jgi:hypothetical protein
MQLTHSVEIKYSTVKHFEDYSIQLIEKVGNDESNITVFE